MNIIKIVGLMFTQYYNMKEYSNITLHQDVRSTESEYLPCNYTTLHCFSEIKFFKITFVVMNVIANLSFKSVSNSTVVE